MVRYGADYGGRACYGLIFEFDDDGVVTPGVIGVEIGSPTAMRDAVIVSMNSFLSFRVHAQAGAGAGEVVLVHEYVGTAGNQPIVEVVADPLFVVAGMVGGTDGSGQYQTDAHAEDLGGAIDRDMVEDAVDINRPLGERVRLAYVDMIENWDSIFRWPARVGEVGIDEHVLTLDGTLAEASVQTELGGATAGWGHVTHNAILRLGAGQEVNYAFRLDPAAPATNYEVLLTQGFGPGNVTLRRNGVLVATGTAPIPASTLPSRATGTVTVVDGASLIDGETLTIDDGYHPPVTFEFDTSGAVAAGNVSVPFVVADSIDRVRDAFIRAVNLTPFHVRAERAEEDADDVNLVHRFASSLGNQVMADTVADPGFVAAGMSGGGGPVDVLLSVREMPVVGGREVQVAVNGTVAASATDAAPLATGELRWRALAGNIASVAWCEVLPAAPEIRVLNP